MGGMLSMEPKPTFQKPTQSKSYYTVPSQTANYEQEMPKATTAYYNPSHYYCDPHGKTVTADMYDNQYYRHTSQDNEDQGYRPQLGMDQMQMYQQGMNYQQWYQSQYMPQTSIPSQQQEPVQSHIAGWLRNVEDNAHLQQPTDTQMPYEYAQQPYDLATKAEDGESAGSKRGLETSPEWLSQQPPKKRALWNNYQISTSSPQESQTPLAFSQETSHDSARSVRLENSNHLSSQSTPSLNQNEIEQSGGSDPSSCTHAAPPAAMPDATEQPNIINTEEITVDELPNPSIES